MENIVDILRKNIGVDKNTDIIADLLEDRAEGILNTIMENKNVKKYDEEMYKIEKKIRKSSNDSQEIFSFIEEYEAAFKKKQCLYEKLLYQCGLYDGITIFMDGIKKIDISNELKKNE